MRQITPTKKIERILEKQLQALEIAGSCANVLNLGALSNHPGLLYTFFFVFLIMQLAFFTRIERHNYKLGK